MEKQIQYWLLVSLVLGSLLPATSLAADKPIDEMPGLVNLKGKPVLGWAEKVRVSPGGLILHAKLSPATDVLSINAQNMSAFKRSGKRYVRFEISDRYGNEQKLELPVLRKASIKRLTGKSQSRYVVELGLCLAGLYQEEEVTLVDRSSSEYDMIIGRDFLAGRVIVDPSSSFTAEPKCSPGKDSIAFLFR